jgi:putative transposase
MNHSHLKRLERIWVEHPVFFITTNTAGKGRILAKECTANILIEEWRQAHKRHGWAIGPFVIMPDHVHFFCTPDVDSESLSDFMLAWKQWTSKRIKRECGEAGTVWQEEFFDHVLRNEESYEEKREYIVQNPVRANLTKTVEDWPWQGEIEVLL